MSAAQAGRHRPALIAFFVTFVVLLAADLAIKSLAFTHVAPSPVDLARDANGQMAAIPPHNAMIVIPKVLALQLTVNHGAVFGLGQGGRWIFVVFSVVATGVILGIFLRSLPKQHVLHFTLAAVLAGALGNLYDRLFVGGVRDMFLLFPDVKLPFGWTWPGGADGLYPWIFNFADVCLVVGLMVLMFIMYLADRAASRATQDTDA